MLLRPMCVCLLTIVTLLSIAEPSSAQSPPAQAAPSAQSPQSALERVRAKGRLRIGIDATYPPFGSIEGGEFSGFDVDLARAIARDLRVQPELVNASFEGVFPALQNGSFDAVISAVSKRSGSCPPVNVDDTFR